MDHLELEAAGPASQARPRYPQSLINRLARLAEGGPVLDVGAGTGELARHLASRGLNVAALEASEDLIAKGQRLPHGQRVEWRHGTWRTGPFGGRHALVVAGEAVRTLPFDEALPRLRAAVGGWFALAGRGERVDGGMEPLLELLKTWSGRPVLPMHDEVAYVTKRRGFRRVGHWRAQAETVLQPMPIFVRTLNHRYALGLERDAERLESFYEAASEVLSRYHGGMVRMVTAPWVVWGRITGSSTLVN